MSSLKKTLLLLALSTPAHAGVALPGGASTKEFPTCGVRISLGNGAGFHCEADPAATEHAGTEYAALGLGPNTLRLENDGGGGTKCKHWDEDSFAVAGSSELMTGGFEAGLYQPISRMTVAALDDLGVYGPLNYDAADPYPATRRKLEEGPGFEVLTPTESFTLDGDDEYVVEVEPVPLGA